MDLEYLIIGIAKGKEEDFEEFYRRTCSGVFGFALSYVKDRFLAREIAVEAYRRVKKLAYKFDSDLNGEFWLLGIVKNLCVNALCDGEISRIAALHRADNLTHLLRQAIFETDEDRGKLLVLRNATHLSKQEIAELLWYRRASADGEYRRGIRQLVALQEGGLTAEEVKAELREDLVSCTPEYLSLIAAEKETAVASFSHDNLTVDEGEFALPGESSEARKLRLTQKAEKKRKRLVTGLSVTASVILLAVAGFAIWYFALNGRSLLKEPDEESIPITPPQYNTRVALCEQDGILYFQNLAQGGMLYSLDMRDGSAAARKLSDDVPKELLSDGAFLYYRKDGTGHFYRRALPDGESEQLDLPNGSILRIRGDRFYFSSRNGISAAKKDGSELQELLTVTAGTQLLREDIEIAEDGTVYFSGGASGGLYRLEQTEAGYVYEPVADGYIYDFSIAGQALIFDALAGDGTGTLRRVDISPENLSDTATLDAVLLSAAFYVKGDFIYYYGLAETEDGRQEKGIYRIRTDSPGTGGGPELVLSLADSRFDVSDLYVTDDFLYCYFCSGEKDSAYMRLSAYALAPDGLSAGTAKDARVIFSTERG